MCSPAFLMFMATAAQLALLVLVTFSTPFIKALYFLRTDSEGGVRFGLLGFCFDLLGICTPKEIGYKHEPEIVDRLSTVLVLYPVAAGLTLLGLLTLLPLMCHRRDGGFLFVMFALFSTLAFFAAAGAFAVTMYLFTTVMHRFHAEGYSASYGPSIWIALAATALSLMIALNSGCGTCLGGRFGRQPRHLAYTY
ncbi:pali-domain-containing protein [Cubamyces sp. BRFM 1775]|nr:pali-domain-containing protein [Cubamyces sp. BRFM 1775]